MFSRIIALFVLLLALPGAVSAVEVEKTEFVVVLRDRVGNQTIFRSNIVPLIPKFACYGWRIRLARSEKLVKFKEILSLPTEPEYWGGENNEYGTNDVAKDRKSAVTERFVSPKNQWIQHLWCVAKGDPEGDYTMDVHLDGAFVKRFEFEVRNTQNPPPKP